MRVETILECKNFNVSEKHSLGQFKPILTHGLYSAKQNLGEWFLWQLMVINCRSINYGDVRNFNFEMRKPGRQKPHQVTFVIM